MTAGLEPNELVLYVAIDRDVEPALYADLVRRPKGRKRVHRLRVLALQGLLCEREAVTPASAVRKPATPTPRTPVKSPGAVDVFSGSDDDD